MNETIVAIIIPIASAVISLFSAVYAVSLGKRMDLAEKQDEQTKWVDRLLNVAVTTNDKFGQHEILQILSCLRPIENKGNSNWDEFSDKSIKYCTSLQSKNKLTEKEKNTCRLIANTLLKKHWEKMSYKNNRSIWKFFKACLVYFLPFLKDKTCFSYEMDKLDEIYKKVVKSIDN